MVTVANPARTLNWRVVDIIVASILAVACGLVFVFWNSVGYAWFMAMDALTPALGGVAAGVRVAGGVIDESVIGKPGAALYVEALAGTVSAVFCSQWGRETLYAGLAQGLGVEIVFAIFLYRRFSLPVAVLGGIGAALGAFVLELFTSANIAKSLE